MSGFDYTAVDWPSVFQTITDGPRGTQSRLSLEMGIDNGLLSRLYKRHLADNTFDPAKHTWGGNNRTFSQQQERAMKEFLIDDLACDGISMPQSEIQKAALASYTQEHGRMTRQHNFVASNGWTYNFKKRQRLSGRVSQKERKHDPDPKAVSAFMEEMKIVRAIFSENRIYNTDETPVRIAPVNCFTTQEIGKPTPAVRRNAGVKDVVSAIATIRQDGEKLPLAIVAKGKTPHCVKNLDLHDEVVRYFSPSGKTNTEICASHIEKISEW